MKDAVYFEKPYQCLYIGKQNHAQKTCERMGYHMLSKLSVRKPFTVLVVVALVLVLGGLSFRDMNTDLLPKMELPYAIVMTSYVGASPEEVETSVTKPVEQAMASISNIKTISSNSRDNVSMVMLEFEQAVNMDSAMIEMRESLDTISAIWEDTIGNPIIMKMNPEMLPIMVAGIDYDDKSSLEVTDLVNQEVIPDLESVEGVASVSAAGEIEEKIEVIIREEKVKQMNREVRRAINAQLSDAEKKIDEGVHKIEDGERTLEDRQGDAAKKMADGENKLSKASSQISDGLKEVDRQITQVKSQRTELLAQEKKLNDGLSEIKKAKDKLQENLSSLKKAEEELNKIQTGLKKLSEQRTMLYEQIALTDNQAAKAALKSALQLVERQLAQIDEELKSQNMTRDDIDKKLNEVSGGVDKLESTLVDLNKQEAELIASKPAITKAKKQIADGLKKLRTARQKLKNGEITTDKAIKQLSEQKILASIQLSVAQANLSSGKSKLDDAKKQFDDTKKETKKSSDLNKVLTTEMVKGILMAENFEMPAGYITEDDVDYLVRVGDDIPNAKGFKDLVIMDYDIDGLKPIKLKDVADVIITDNSAEVYAKIDGKPAVALTMEKQSGYSTGDVSDRILEKFDEMQSADKEMHITTLMDQGVYIDLVVGSVFENLLMGGILAIFILLIFLWDWRPTLIVACSIPFSLVSTIVLMYFTGVTLNIISLSGLALGVGMLVDNSIVVIENIYRLRKEGVSAKKAAVEGAKGVAGAITASTLTTICVFAPIIFTDGLTRQLFVDLGLTLAYSLIASLVVALTLIPALAAGTLRKTRETKDTFLGVVYRFYAAVMKKLLHAKIIVVLVSLGLMVLTAFLASRKGTSLMPEMESTQASVTYRAEKEATFEEATEISDKIMDAIKDIPDITTIGAMSGGANMMMNMGGMGGGGSRESVDMYIMLNEERTLTNDELADMITERTKGFPGEVTVETAGMDMSALGGNGISIQVKGKDLDRLQEITDDIIKRIEHIKGLKEISNGLDEDSQEFHISINKGKAMSYQLTVAQVFEQIRLKAAEATAATTIETDTKDYDIFVKDEANETLERKDIRNMDIEYTTKEGKKKNVKLSEIADFSVSLAPKGISRDNQSRTMRVRAELEDDYNIGLVSEEVNEALDGYQAPEGYEYIMEGEDASINESMEQVMLMLVVGILFMYLIMVAQFQSLLSPFIILFTLPLAFTGGFLGLMIAGKEISVIAMIGFVMLSGIIVNNGIVLVDYINQLRRGGMERTEAMILAGQVRMRPILMTAMTTILGLSTMAFGMGMGSDMVQPMAIVTIGGLIYGTILTLVVVPCIYGLLTRKKSMVKDEIV